MAAQGDAPGPLPFLRRIGFNSLTSTTPVRHQKTRRREAPTVVYFWSASRGHAPFAQSLLCD